MGIDGAIVIIGIEIEASDSVYVLDIFSNGDSGFKILI